MRSKRCAAENQRITSTKKTISSLHPIVPYVPYFFSHTQWYVSGSTIGRRPKLRAQKDEKTPKLENLNEKSLAPSRVPHQILNHRSGLLANFPDHTYPQNTCKGLFTWHWGTQVGGASHLYIDL